MSTPVKTAIACGGWSGYYYPHSVLLLPGGPDAEPSDIERRVIGYAEAPISGAQETTVARLRAFAGPVAVPETCPECNGAKAVPCKRCEGKRRVRCVCPHCDDDHDATCPECDGKSLAVCRECDGDGVVSPVMDPVSVAGVTVDRASLAPVHDLPDGPAQIGACDATGAWALSIHAGGARFLLVSLRPGISPTAVFDPGGEVTP
jgi:hypothetical protein